MIQAPGKAASLLRKSVNYVSKKFYDTGPRIVQCLRVRQEPTQVKHLSGAPLKVRLRPDLAHKHQTRLERLTRGQNFGHSYKSLVKQKYGFVFIWFFLKSAQIFNLNCIFLPNGMFQSKTNDCFFKITSIKLITDTQNVENA